MVDQTKKSEDIWFVTYFLPLILRRWDSPLLRFDLAILWPKVKAEAQSAYHLVSILSTLSNETGATLEEN